MTAIDYVARKGSGISQRGSVSGGSDVSVIPAGGGQEISLNLRQIDIAKFDRDGSNLVINLADGRIVILEGYFGEDGMAESRLFISADGYLNEVTLIEGSEGAIYAQYGPTEMWGKWSPSDDLVFLGGSEVAPAVAAEEEVSMLGAGLLGGSGLMSALGLGAAGVAATSVLANEDSGGGSTRIVPSVNEDQPIIVGGDDISEDDKSIPISGEGEPDSDVTVTIGDETQATTVDETGEWQVTFDGNDFPDDGDYTVEVTVTEPDGTQTELDGPSITIDATAPQTVVEGGTLDATGIVNDDDFQDGVEISGTGEVGSTIEVTIEGHTETTTVDESGTWTVTFDPADLPQGDYETEMTVVSTDNYDNSSTITETVSIDTIYNALEISTGSNNGNSLINSEAVQTEGGVVITGTTEPGATVTVAIGSVSREVTADGDGNWQATFDPADLPSQQFEATVTATTTDDAGNITTTSNTVEIDLVVQNFSHQADIGNADSVISASEIDQAFVLTGTVEPGSTVWVVIDGVRRMADVDQTTGEWAATFESGALDGHQGEVDMVVEAQDRVGNLDTIPSRVLIDTVVDNLASEGSPETANGFVGLDAARDGMELAGTAEAGSAIEVMIFDKTYEAVADPDGNWSLKVPRGDIPNEEGTAQISVLATDIYGNEDTTTGSVTFDMVAPDSPLISDLTEAASDGYSYMFTAPTADTVEFHLIDGSGVTAVDVDSTTLGSSVANEFMDVSGNPAPLPDGSQLLVTATDQAGNTSSTYVAPGDNSMASLSDLQSAGLGDLQIETVDLRFGDHSEMTVTEEQLLALSDNTDTLVVKGEGDNTLVMRGATPEGGGTTAPDGYDIYTLGDDATLVVDEDIDIVT
jgi:hypothetical protein